MSSRLPALILIAASFSSRLSRYSKPCLVGARRPVDSHHVRFAQKQALGRKVSDEFTVPLCRSHHRELHRSGSEYLWWENVGVDPLKIAHKLWKKTRPKGAQTNDDRRGRAPMSAARSRTKTPQAKTKTTARVGHHGGDTPPSLPSPAPGRQ